MLLRRNDESRSLATTGFGQILQQAAALQPPYYVTKDDELGTLDYSVTLGNPLKGLTSNPNIKNPHPEIKYSLESFYFSFKDVVYGYKQYNWTKFELQLNSTYYHRNSHAIPRFLIHYPGDEIDLPQYLLDIIELRPYGHGLGKGMSPYYGDIHLVEAIQDFIIEFGKKYDGDKRIFCIQAGLLGFFGEWHTGDYDYVPAEIKEQVVELYGLSFNKTLIQIRFPNIESKAQQVGYHDDSFTFTTIDGDANGGVYQKLFFWNRITMAGEKDFWKYSPMGGEVRPENAEIIFSDSYPSNTENHQDFLLCAQTTHATYMKNAALFRAAELTQYEIDKANNASISMGYAFYIPQVTISKSTSSPDTHVDIDVAVQQVGIAPFYYPLSLVLSCNGIGLLPRMVSGIEQVIENKDFNFFTFRRIPATETCLNEMKLSLYSSMVSPNNAIRFAQKQQQGTNDGSKYITFRLPLPPSSEAAAVVPLPSSKLTKPPTPAPLANVINCMLVDAFHDIILGPVINNTIIDLSTMNTTELTIVADIPDATSAVFNWTEGKSQLNKVHAEKLAPFTMNGDSNRKFKKEPYVSTIGPKAVTVTGRDSSGNSIASQTIYFQVIQG